MGLRKFTQFFAEEVQPVSAGSAASAGSATEASKSISSAAFCKLYGFKMADFKEHLSAETTSMFAAAMRQPLG